MRAIWFPSLNESWIFDNLWEVVERSLEEPMSIEFRSEVNADRAILYCAGQLKAGKETSELRERVTHLLHQRSTVVLDLGRIYYIDSGALSVLVGLYSSARTAHAEIKYQNLVTPVSYNRPKQTDDLAAA